MATTSNPAIQGFISELMQHNDAYAVMHPTSMQMMRAGFRTPTSYEVSYYMENGRPMPRLVAMPSRTVELQAKKSGDDIVLRETNSAEETRRVMIEMMGLNSSQEIPVSRFRNRMPIVGPSMSSGRPSGEVLRELGGWVNEALIERQIGIISEKKSWASALVEAHSVLVWDAAGLGNNANGGNSALEGIKDRVNYGLKPSARGAGGVERIGGGLSALELALKYGASASRSRNSYVQVDVFSSRISPEYRTVEVTRYAYNYDSGSYERYPLLLNDPIVRYLRTGK